MLLRSTPVCQDQDDNVNVENAAKVDQTLEQARGSEDFRFGSGPLNVMWLVKLIFFIAVDWSTRQTRLRCHRILKRLDVFSSLPLEGRLQKRRFLVDVGPSVNCETRRYHSDPPHFGNGTKRFNYPTCLGVNEWACKCTNKRSEKCRASWWVSGASEWVSRLASGPVQTSRFQDVLNHCGYTRVESAKIVNGF